MARPLKRGQLRRQVTLYDIPESNIDSFGQPSQLGVEIGVFDAFIQPLQGNERLNDRQIWPTVTHRILMDWLGNAISPSTDNPNGYIMPQMKLVDVLDSSVYNVVFAENIETRDRYWIIMVEQKIGATS